MYPVRVIIADDHAVVRDGLRAILEAKAITVIGEAKNGREAMTKAEDVCPDVILMDVAMRELNGIEATRLIYRCFPSIRIIILSMHHTAEHVARAIRAGAKGYLLKETVGVEVVEAVAEVMKGGYYFGNGVQMPHDALSTLPWADTKGCLDSLRQREREVLQLVVEGNTTVEIAALLSLSPKTVNSYRHRGMVKLGIDNVPSLVQFALLQGITPS